MERYGLLYGTANRDVINEAVKATGEAMNLSKEPKAQSAALLAAQAIAMMEAGTDGVTVENMQDCIALALCVNELMPEIDEPRYSMYDYVDAVINAAWPVNVSALLNLGSEDFQKSLVWLARYKRETYEAHPHVGEPLDVDIFYEKPE